MSQPPFVMSKYASLEDLLTDKCKYLTEQNEILTKRLEIADPDGETLSMLYDENGEFVDYG